MLISIFKTCINLVTHFVKLIKSKKFQTLLIIITGFSVFLFSNNTWAAGCGNDSNDAGVGVYMRERGIDGCIESKHAYHSLKVSDHLVAPGQHNQKSHELNLISKLLTFTNFVMPELNTNYPQLVADPTISPLSKMGAVTISEQAMKVTLQSQPNFDVNQHLAQQWIPGYEDDLSTYALGFDSGYDYLANGADIQQFWTKTLTVSYIFFVIVLIVTGFMIMFRSKIGGQTAVTLFNTLPNVIISLVLVTFSFAIVGLILDLSILSTVVVGYFLYGSNWRRQALFIDWPFSIFFYQDAGAEALERVFWGTINTVGTPVTAGGIRVISGLIAGLDGVMEAIISGDNILSSAEESAKQAATSGPMAMLFYLIIAFAYIVASVKVFVTLLKALIGILIDTIIGPLVLTVAAIPGKQSLRNDWFMRLFRNAFTFPVVFFIVNFAEHLISIDLNISYLSHGSWKFVEGHSIGSALSIPIMKLLVAGAKVILPLVMYFTAGNVENIMKEIFPTQQSQGLQATVQGVQADMSKIPVLKRLVGGGKK